MQPIEIHAPPRIWLPCKRCRATTRHILTNPEYCQEEATYICCYKCISSEFTTAKEFYHLYYRCAIDENDDNLVYTK